VVQNPTFNLSDDGTTPLDQAARQRAPRDPDFFLARLKPSTVAALDPAQLDDVRAAIAEAIPQPQPKIIDIRFVINLIFDRYYVVLFMGKDMRRQSRQQPTWVTRLSNFMVALLLLLSCNLVISLTLGMGMYLIKSAVGIDLFPGHLNDRVESL
jgi:hypothetical protein